MYSLVMLLTGCGILALDRALRRPRPGNLLAVAVVTAALLYTQYWSLYLVATVAVWLIWRVWKTRPSDRRTAARGPRRRWLSGAWPSCPGSPPSSSSRRHTGTPWAAPAQLRRHDQRGHRLHRQPGHPEYRRFEPGPAAGRRVLRAGRAGPLRRGPGSLARRPRPADPAVRAGPWPSSSWSPWLLAVTGGIVSQERIRPRYASVVFIPLLLLVAVGTRTLADARVRNSRHGGGRGGRPGPVSVAERLDPAHEAPEVAAVLAAQAHAGRRRRLLPGPAGARGLPADRPSAATTSDLPPGHQPGIRGLDRLQVDQSTPPTRRPSPHHLLALAGSTHQIWLVWAPRLPVASGPSASSIGHAIVDHPGLGRAPVGLPPARPRTTSRWRLTQFARQTPRSP